MCCWSCLYGDFVCLRVRMHDCEYVCLYGGCVVFVCVPCHFYMVIVRLCMDACMFVCVFVWWLCCVCMCIWLCLNSDCLCLRECIHVCERVRLYKHVVVFVCVSGNVCMVVVCVC